MATGQKDANANLKRFKEMLRNPRAFMFKAALLGHGRWLQELAVANPRTFNQKVRYRMVHDRRPLLGVFADKLAAKEYVESRVGRGHTAEVLEVAEPGQALRAASLPREFALKVNHASGGVILVFDAADPTGRLPEPGLPFSRHALRPDAMDFEAANRVVDAWLNMKYGTKNGEWAYSQCRPRAFVEEFLHASIGGPPPDLKLFVFNGKCQMMRLDTPSGDRKALNHYLADGTPVKVRFGEYHGELFTEVAPAPALPSAWREAVTLAEALGEGIDFVRVDTFQLGDRVLIGELTNYPTNGTGRYLPPSFDRWLGAWWR